MIMDTLCKKLLWLALLLVVSTSVTAQENVSKKITKTYAMTNVGELHLENKYGNININGWDKDEVFVEIAITVNHRKKENAEDLLMGAPSDPSEHQLKELNIKILEKKK